MNLNPENLRACGIDPGTDTLGYAIVELDPSTLKISLDYVETFHAAKATRKLPDLSDLLGNRGVRLNWHTQNLSKMFHHHKPHTVTVESPFLGRFATAFEALIECRSAIRKALLDYSETITMELIDPLSVKSAMGALKPLPPRKKGKRRKKKATGKTKEEIKDALKKIKDVDWGDYTLDDLDEHSIDAIAVALYRVYILRDILQKEKTNLKIFRG